MARGAGWEGLLSDAVAGSGSRACDALRAALVGSGTAREVLALAKALLDSLAAPTWTEEDVRGICRAFNACLHALGGKSDSKRLR